MGENVSNEDLYKLIQSVVKNTEAIQNQNDKLRQELKDEVKSIKTELSLELENIKAENEILKEENQKLNVRLSTAEQKLKKFNIVVYGLEEEETDLPDIEKFLSIINKKLKINCRFEDLRDIYRIGQKTEGKIRPLSVELLSYRLKLVIFEKAKELKGTNIYICNDYTPAEYQKQKVLRQHLKVARENNYQATIKKSTLYVDGQQYTYEEIIQHTSQEKEQKENRRDQLGKEEDLVVNVNKPLGTKTFSFMKEKRKRKTSDNSLAENPLKRSTRQATKSK